MTSFLLLGTSAGCLSTRVVWRDPRTPSLLATELWDWQHCLDQAEQLYKEGLELEDAGCEQCVDKFFEAALLTASHFHLLDQECSTAEFHRIALIKTIETGQCFKRLDPRYGLRINQNGLDVLVPIEHIGFVWEQESFQSLVPIGRYETNGISRKHRSCGVGLPLIVSTDCHRETAFISPYSAFAATMVMRVNRDEGNCVIELYDPLRVKTVVHRNNTYCLARDITAPLVYKLRDQRTSILSGFTDPASYQGESQLYMLEPFQPNKVPVVFVHGLLSDPFTWLEMVNEVRSFDGFVDQFQLWAFDYPTGQQFLASAAKLREQLNLAVNENDPSLTDTGLANMVLVGHSLGGLISKLQVVDSGDVLWNSISNKPIEAVKIDPTIEQRMMNSFYFDAAPFITRTVYIGTPHKGSVYAQRLVGKIGNSLVKEPESLKQGHRRLISDNPGVFHPQITNRIPTSLDLLEPDSVLLKAIDSLPIKPYVTAHSMIGNSRRTIGYGPSDGVVAVSSARDRDSVTERFIFEKHADVHKHPDAVEELLCILRTHWIAIQSASNSLEENGIEMSQIPHGALSADPAMDGYDREDAIDGDVSTENVQWRARAQSAVVVE